ncbi:MAG TPA: hypothetical protein VGQ36_19195 [Thermoanaerobaculia bacterium]|jgi:hypothetical protein|nr:hypothetical protein [Thermoanaerobaculia bacterium]
MNADFIVYSKTGKLTALVGVSGYRETDAAWAEEMVPGYLRTFDPPYLVVVARDQIWFWQDPARNPKPVGSIPTAVHLAKYARPLRKDIANIYIGTLESIVLSWMFDVTGDASTLPEFVHAIGFPDAVHWGDVQIAA